MARSIDQITDYAEYLLQCCRQQPSKLLKSNHGSISKSKCIYQRLLDLYVEEKKKETDDKEIDFSSHLLAKLVKRDKLNCLILNLYPANEGYSLLIKTKSGMETETIRLPYEESELLEYIDDAQLSPFMVDLLEKAHINVFYSGCVIIEVRDYRRSTSGSYDSQYVLLRPTSQSLLSDINTIISENNILTQEDQFALESELLLRTEEPLCLNPSPVVCLVKNRIQFEEKNLCTANPHLKRCVKKFTQTAVNRKRKLSQQSAPKPLKLFDFITRKRDKHSLVPVKQNPKTSKSCVDIWKQKNVVNLAAPSVLEVDQYVKVLEKPPLTGGVEYPKILVEEHTLEREPNQEKHMLAKITIKKRPSDDTYFGELYLDYEYSANKSEAGCSCQFILGSRDDVDKYLKQFEQLFTEEGRRLVKITIQKPNLPPQTSYTQTPQGLNSANISITQALIKQANLTFSSQNQGENVNNNNLTSKRNMPIQLSLSIGHPFVTQSNPVPNQSSNVTSATTLQQTSPVTSSLQAQVNQAQKLKQTAPHAASRISSGNKTPGTSPATTPATTPTHQVAGFSGIVVNQQQNASSLQQKAPTPTLTPPPNSRTPTPTSTASSRKISEQTTNIPAMNLTTYIQGLVSSAPSISTSKTQVVTSDTSSSNVGTNINITNLGGLQPNFNIQGLTPLSGMNLTNIQGLQNMQVSLTGVHSAAIAVPISMINSNPSILQNQTGIFVSSLPTLSTTTSSSEPTTISTTVASVQNSSSTASTPGVVTMVTGLPSVTTTSSIPATTVAPQVIMSTGLTSNPSTVLPQSSSMLSLPIGLAQFMPVGSKAQGSTGLQASASLPLVQLPGQQSMQHLILPPQRAQLKTCISQGHTSVVRPQTTSGTHSVPISTVLTQSQVAALTSLSAGKHGAQGTLTAQQFMQLTGQTGATLQQSPQLTTPLTFQKPQSSQPLQFHHLQVKPNTPPQNKPKVKKKTTPTTNK